MNRSEPSFAPQIIDSKIEEQVTLYPGTKINRSSIESNSHIGDFSRVTNSQLSSWVRADRNTLLYHCNVGSFTYFGAFCMAFHCSIGKFSSISWSVTLGPAEHDFTRLTSHDFLYNDFYGLREPADPAPYDRFSQTLEIGNDVWIGASSIILRGASIGDGAVVGAGSVVTSAVPPYAIVAGNPGRVLRYRFPPEIVERLKKINWWNKPAVEIKRLRFALSAKDITEIEEALEELERT